jgi:hypothetical protein
MNLKEEVNMTFLVIYVLCTILNWYLLREMCIQDKKFKPHTAQFFVIIAPFFNLVFSIAYLTELIDGETLKRKLLFLPKERK